MSCSDTFYGYTVSTSNYPSKPYAEYLINDTSFASRFPIGTNLTYDLIKTRIASVNVFYNQLIETVSSETPRETIVDVISKVGGILGLFLGRLYKFNLQ